MRFITMFPEAENIHLIKDVGQIPYILQQEYGFDSAIVCYPNGDYPYLHSEVKGLKMDFLSKEKRGSTKKQKIYCEMLYIIKNAKKIDVLNMYHLSCKNSLLLFNIYKLINQRGVAYLKLDFPPENIDIIRRYSFIKKKILKFLLRAVDIISVESSEMCDQLQKYLGRSILYIPNGFYQPPKNRENVIRNNTFLTVGRLGTWQKDTETLIKAFLKIYKKCNWNLILTGTLEDHLNSYLNRIFETDITLKNRIIVTGEIIDQQILSGLYKSAKVFVLPSRTESFGIVSVEALSNGCYLLISDGVVSSRDIIENDSIGKIFPIANVDILADQMLHCTKIDFDTEILSKSAYSRFSWNVVLKLLNDKILERSNV